MYQTLCARVSGLLVIVTQNFRLRAIAESFVRTSFSRISRMTESERRKRWGKKKKKVTRALFAAYTPRYDPEKSMLVILRPGMLPGILIADLNVKHTATGIPVRYAWLFSVAYQNFHPSSPSPRGARCTYVHSLVCFSSRKLLQVFNAMENDSLL